MRLAASACIPPVPRPLFCQLNALVYQSKTKCKTRSDWPGYLLTIASIDIQTLGLKSVTWQISKLMFSCNPQQYLYYIEALYQNRTVVSNRTANVNVTSKVCRPLLLSIKLLNLEVHKGHDSYDYQLAFKQTDFLPPFEYLPLWRNGQRV